MDGETISREDMSDLSDPPDKLQMIDGRAVKRDVLIALEYSYIHDDWVHPLTEALDGVTAEEALWRSGPKTKGIWDIVLHMAVWTENIVLRKRSGEIVRPEDGPWPPPPAIPDEAAWQAAQQRLWDSLASLRSQLERDPPSALLDAPYGMGDLLCRFIHNAYHIGQITKMREMREAQERTV
jgi:hypothetical protein